MNLLTKVKTLMTTDLITVTPNASIDEVIALFTRHGFHHLPVVNDGHSLAGIISLIDLFKARENNRAGATAATIMTSGLASLEPNDTLRTATNLFALNRFHALPVKEGAKIVGIFTTHDLIKWIDSQKTSLADYRSTEA